MKTEVVSQTFDFKMRQNDLPNDLFFNYCYHFCFYDVLSSVVTFPGCITLKTLNPSGGM